MSKYGQAAINAVSIIKSNSNITPKKAWTSQVGEDDTHSCTKLAFLGLCENGLIRGVPANTNYGANHSINKAYAINAVTILKSNNTLTGNKSELFRQAVLKSNQGTSKTHNHQMDVVVELWNSGLII